MSGMKCIRCGGACYSDFRLCLKCEKDDLEIQEEHDFEQAEMSRKRNRIYRTCGLTIFACGLSIVWFSIFAGQAWMDRYCITLILEWIMLTAFGVAWVIKGETLFKDKK